MTRERKERKRKKEREREAAPSNIVLNNPILGSGESIQDDEVENHHIRMENLSRIRDIDTEHILNTYKHIRSPLTPTSLTSLCETLDRSYRSSWYTRIALNCEKVDERISQLSESITETKKRLRDTLTNIITSAIAFAVVLVNGMLNDQTLSTVVTNLSGILLNILLAIKALVEALLDRKTQAETQETLLMEYKNERWEINRYVGASNEDKDTIDKTEIEQLKAQHATEKKELDKNCEKKLSDWHLKEERERQALKAEWNIERQALKSEVDKQKNEVQRMQILTSDESYDTPIGSSISTESIDMVEPYYRPQYK